MTKKDNPWEWKSEHEQAFQELKSQFTKEPVLQIPDPHAPFQLECDASEVATGAVLRQQDQNGI